MPAATRSMTVGEMTYALNPDLDTNIIEDYKNIYSLWDHNRRNCLKVYISGYPKAFRIPLDWVQTSGLGDWSFVSDVVQVLVNEPGTLVKPIGRYGTPLAANEPLQSGEYVYVPNSEGPFVPPKAVDLSRLLLWNRRFHMEIGSFRRKAIRSRRRA